MGEDFINPKSMITPGAAGALLMFMVNGLCYSFPELEPRMAALVLSFIIGTVVFKAGSLRVGERTAYWVINSLIIFVMGTGAANIAAKASSEPEKVAAISHGISMSFIPEAVAQETADVDLMKKRLDEEQAEKEKMRLELERLKKRLNEVESKKEPQSTDKPKEREGSPPPSRPFFRQW